MDYPVSKSLTRMSTMLFEPHQARRWNCGLNLYLKVYLRKVNPANGAAEGTAPDWDTTNTPGSRARNIVRWGDDEFRTWTERYQRECQSFWDTRFWLCTPATFSSLDFSQNRRTFRPNIRCGLHLTLVSTPSAADHTIDVVKLAPTETFYRSDSAHYDNRDIDATTTNAGFLQRAHVHEVGHLLGLGHSNEGDASCVNNNPVCYANDNVMGGGESVAPWNASPWQKAIQAVTGVAATQWRVSLAEVLPSVR